MPRDKSKKKPRTKIYLVVEHEKDYIPTWDDFILRCQELRDRGVPLPVHKVKDKNRKQRENHRLAMLVRSQKADEHDRKLRFEHATR